MEIRVEPDGKVGVVHQGKLMSLDSARRNNIGPLYELIKKELLG